MECAIEEAEGLVGGVGVENKLGVVVGGFLKLSHAGQSSTTVKPVPTLLQGTKRD